MIVLFCSDRFRTTNNMLGDCYTAAIVEAWSKSELEAMDNEGGMSNKHYYASDAEKSADLTPLVTRNDISHPQLLSVSVRLTY